MTPYQAVRYRCKGPWSLLVSAWLLMKPFSYQITYLSKEVFILKEALKVQQAAPSRSKEEQDALCVQATAMQQGMELLAM